MLTRILIVIVFSGLVSACDDTASRLAHEAKVCEKAVELGDLELAEEHCQRALGDADDDVLVPQTRSERLFKLASIKRQLGKYVEAAEPLSQSLELEETLSGPDSPQVASRHLEMSLIMAGQGQWAEGAQLLEQIVLVAGQLNEKEQASLVNVLRHYAVQLQKSQHTEQASRLQAAAASLKLKEAAITDTRSPDSGMP
jgi:tetratricopeptide (TPR) repeat protein